MKLTQSEITDMARAAGGMELMLKSYTSWLGTSTPEFLEKFAELVAARAAKEEREACAKVCEASPSYDWHRFACETADAIRARGAYEPDSH